jgi:Flp pilus assembly pilin Flp
MNQAGFRHRGQGMTEYIIIVALIAVAAIGTYQFFGQTVRNQTAGIAAEISGQNAQTQISNSQTAAGSASSEGNSTKGLSSYNTNSNSQR